MVLCEYYELFELRTGIILVAKYSEFNKNYYIFRTCELFEYTQFSSGVVS
jgi:hypothetical protein